MIKMRLCVRCERALRDLPDQLLIVLALAELGHYRCPFDKWQCGKFFDASGKVLAVTELAIDTIWLNRQ